MPELLLERVNFLSLVDEPAVPQAEFLVSKSDETEREVIAKHADAPDEPADTTTTTTTTMSTTDDTAFSGAWISGIDDANDGMHDSIAKQLDANSDDRMSSSFVADAVEVER